MQEGEIKTLVVGKKNKERINKKKPKGTSHTFSYKIMWKKISKTHFVTQEICNQFQSHELLYIIRCNFYINFM